MVNKAVTRFGPGHEPLVYPVTLVISLIIPFALGMLFYGEPFKVKEYPLSFIGRRMTPEGFVNTLAQIIFGLGMLVCMLVMLFWALHYLQQSNNPNRKWYGYLSLLTALGFLMMVFPCDGLHTRLVHVYGSAFVIGGHFFLLAIRLIALRKTAGLLISVALLVGFIAPVLNYAFFWLVKHPLHGLMQKPAFLSLILFETLACVISRYRGESPWITLRGKA